MSAGKATTPKSKERTYNEQEENKVNDSAHRCHQSSLDGHYVGEKRREEKAGTSGRSVTTPFRIRIDGSSDSLRIILSIRWSVIDIPVLLFR